MDNDVCILSSISDISERKRAEEALREGEALFAAFLDRIPGMAIIKDHELRPVYANRTFRERMPVDQWMGRTPEECFPAELAADMRARDEAALATGFERYEETWPSVDGALRTYDTLKFRVGRAGTTPLLGALIIDITDKKKIEDSIRQRNAELEQWHTATVGRELRMVELKQQVNELSRQLGQPPPYSVDFGQERAAP